MRRARQHNSIIITNNIQQQGRGCLSWEVSSWTEALGSYTYYIHSKSGACLSISFKARYNPPFSLQHCFCFSSFFKVPGICLT